ncbi:TPA: pyocin knob domain-containing protein [Enterococcus faecalis]|nr:hypothetical protein [Enterococcus faecalis]
MGCSNCGNNNQSIGGWSSCDNCGGSWGCTDETECTLIRVNNLKNICDIDKCKLYMLPDNSIWSLDYTEGKLVKIADFKNEEEKEVITGEIRWNNFTQMGIYTLNKIKPNPYLLSDSGILEVLSQQGSSLVIQRYTDTNNFTIQRTLSNGTWTKWQLVHYETEEALESNNELFNIGKGELKAIRKNNLVSIFGEVSNKELLKKNDKGYAITANELTKKFIPGNLIGKKFIVSGEGSNEFTLIINDENTLVLKNNLDENGIKDIDKDTIVSFSISYDVAYRSEID